MGRSTQCMSRRGRSASVFARALNAQYTGRGFTRLVQVSLLKPLNDDNIDNRVARWVRAADRISTGIIDVTPHTLLEAVKAVCSLYKLFISRREIDGLVCAKRDFAAFGGYVIMARLLVNSAFMRGLGCRVVSMVQRILSDRSHAGVLTTLLEDESLRNRCHGIRRQRFLGEGCPMGGHLRRPFVLRNRCQTLVFTKKCVIIDKTLLRETRSYIYGQELYCVQHGGTYGNREHCINSITTFHGKVSSFKKQH